MGDIQEDTSKSNLLSKTMEPDAAENDPVAILDGFALAITRNPTEKEMDLLSQDVTLLITNENQISCIYDHLLMDGCKMPPRLKSWREPGPMVGTQSEEHIRRVWTQMRISWYVQNVINLTIPKFRKTETFGSDEEVILIED